MPSLSFGHLQSQGARDYQEDTIGFQARDDSDSATPAMVVVADGMGGHVGGKTASETAVKAFLDLFAASPSPDVPGRLREALQGANGQLAEAITRNPELDGMGCTLIALAEDEAGWHWISVGDSPILWLNGDDIRRLNADHSMAGVFADLVAEGRMTAEEANTDPRRSALRSALMGREIELVDQSSEPVQLTEGTTLILATDGLDTLASDGLPGIVATAPANGQDIAKRLISAVLAAEAPGQDNVSVAVLTAVSRQDASKLSATTLSRARPKRGSEVSGYAALLRSPYLWLAGGPVLLLLVIWVLLSMTGPGEIDPYVPDAPPQLDLPEAQPGQVEPAVETRPDSVTEVLGSPQPEPQAEEPETTSDQTPETITTIEARDGVAPDIPLEVPDQPQSETPNPE